MLKKVLLFAVVLAALAAIVCGQNTTVLYFFYGQGCPHCAAAGKYLDELQQDYPDLIIDRREVYFNQSNQGVFQEYCKLCDGTPEGVPTFFIDKQMIIGFDQKVDLLLRSEVERCLQYGCSNFEAPISGAPAPEDDVYRTQELIGYIFLIALSIFALIAGIILYKKHVR